MDTATLEKFMHTFYGYGNLNGPYWLIGMEEGGGNTQDEVVRRISIWQELSGGTTVDVAEYHLRLGMPEFFQEPVKLQRTWAHLVRLLLALKEQDTSLPSIRTYQAQQLGRLGGETSLLELLPLPSPSTNAWHYGQWTQLPELRSRKSYRENFLPWRVKQIQGLIAEHRPRLVVFYGVSYRQWAEQVAGRAFSSVEALNIGTLQRQETLFVLIKHPASKGIRSKYFLDTGAYIRRKLNGET